MTKTIIDVDTGTDDAIALIMAVGSPEMEIAGVTTVAGNASLADTTRNTLRLMSALGMGDVPISEGEAKPLEGEPVFAYHYPGPGGLTADLPDGGERIVKARAPDFMLQAAGGDLEIVALGPLTNVARLILDCPDIGDTIRRVYVMGGAVEVGGNVTPWAEFNIHFDPRAANVVFQSGVPVTLVGLEVGNRVSFARNSDDWRAGSSPGEKLAARIIQGWFDIHPDSDRYVLCDPMTVAAALAPDLFECRQATVTVDETGETRGRTRASYGDGSVSVALGVDEERARAFALERRAAGR